MFKKSRHANSPNRVFENKKSKCLDYKDLDLRGVNFSGVILKGADFSNAKFGTPRNLEILLIVSALFSSFLGTFTIAYTMGIITSLFVQGGIYLLVSFVSLIISISSCIVISTQGFSPKLAVLLAIIGILISGVAAIGNADILGGLVVQSIAIFSSITGFFIELIASLTVIFLANNSNKFVVFARIFCLTVGVIFGVLFGVEDTHEEDLIVAFSLSIISTLVFIVSTIRIVKLALKEDARFSLVRKFAIDLASLGGTSFYNADLTNANFTNTALKGVDLRRANLNRTCWQGAKMIELARADNTYLSIPEIRDLLRMGQTRVKNFDFLDLRGVDFGGADLRDTSFISANLNNANLKNADLSNARLMQTQLDRTDLTGAILTGAYIEDWGITGTTKLENVQCEYVFMRVPTQKKSNPLRKPDNWKETFAEGEFADFIQPYFDTLDLYHSQDVDPRAVSISFKKLSQNHPEANLEIVAMEKRGHNSFNLKVQTAPAADKSELSAEYFADYNQLKALSEARLFLLAEKDDRIHSLEQMIQTALHQPTFNVETIQGDLMSENREINISAGDSANISGVSSGDGIVNLGTISGNVTNTINQLPEDSDEKAKLKSLLQQLKVAIESETELSPEDKAEALEQVQTLAEAGQTSQDGTIQKAAKTAMKILKGTTAGLSETTKLVVECANLLPEISGLLLLL